MKTTKRGPHAPERVLQAARLIAPFLRGKMMVNLVFGKLPQAGMARQFGLLGINAPHVSAETQARGISIDWQGTRGFCNLIAHEYLRVDSAKLRQILHDIVSDLCLLLKHSFTYLDCQSGPDADVQIPR